MIFSKQSVADVVWRTLGVSNILLPNGISKESLRAQAIPENAPVSPNLAQTGFGSPARKITPQKTVPPAAAKPAAWKALPLENWPQPWQQQLQKTKKGKLAWTYWNLGEDLASLNPNDAQNKKKRSDCMRRFFKDLGFPAGTHTFWPPVLPQYSVMANPDLFWSALRLLGTRAVVIMGSAAAKALLAEQSLKPMTAYARHGQRVWVLWEIDTLANDESKYQRGLSFLKKVLINFS